MQTSVMTTIQTGRRQGGNSIIRIPVELLRCLSGDAATYGRFYRESTLRAPSLTGTCEQRAFHGERQKAPGSRG